MEVATEIAQFQHATAVVDDAAATVLGLNSTDLRCLGRLFLGSRTASELAAECGLSRGAMTTAIDRLERAGYVRRVRASSDRRQVRIEMTQRATELTEAIWGPIGTSGTKQLAAFDGDQLRFLLDFLRRGRELQEKEAERIRRMPPAARITDAGRSGKTRGEL